MKKFYFLASALLAVTSLKAQITADFENLTLPAESYYNGDDEAGGFVSGGVTFGNKYDTQWDSWSGFAYSNITDNTTAGFGNQYSAVPGNGADNSDIYAIYHNGDTLHLPGSGANLSSVDLTNTTYAYLSMRDGDAFAKEFGSPKDANGDDDGTNGEDYFYITIYSHDATGNKIDSLDFYLADFRFTDDNDDYIINTWTEVDLTDLQNVNYLTFSFHSSDMGQYGINTPLYFALDNFTYYNTTGITSQKKRKFAMYPNPATSILNIKGEAGEYKIYNMQGKVLKEFNHNSGVSTINIAGLKSGVYWVKTASSTKKLVLQ